MIAIARIDIRKSRVLMEPVGQHVTPSAGLAPSRRQESDKLLHARLDGVALAVGILLADTPRADRSPYGGWRM